MIDKKTDPPLCERCGKEGKLIRFWLEEEEWKDVCRGCAEEIEDELVIDAGGYP